MKVVITGAEGQLGRAFQKELSLRGVPFWASDLATCNIASREQVEQMLDLQKPSVLINCAAYNLVDDAENDRALAFEINAIAVSLLAESCYSRGIKFVHYSTDYIFDGHKGGLYIENDLPHPLNVYGESKYTGEVAARTMAVDSLVFRTSWVYGDGKQNFLYKVSQWAGKNEVLKISADEVSVPTYVDDLVMVTLKAIEKDLKGLYHVTSAGYASRYEWAKYFLKAAGLPTLVIPVPLSYFQPKVARPLFSVMSSQKILNELGIQVPCWQEGVEKYVRAWKER